MAHTSGNIAEETGLHEKRVVILGGSSGIGLDVAEQAAAQGASLVIASSNARRIEQAIKSLGNNVEGKTLDLTDERAIESFFQGLGAFDHLVFTAGDALQLGELAAPDLREARQAFELRYWAAVAAVKYGSPQLRSGGSIVLTTGIAGQRPRKGWVLGASVCGSIEALTRALAVELAPIRVNAVSPGVVRTNLWQSMSAPERERLYESLGERLPVGRVGASHDITTAIC